VGAVTVYNGNISLPPSGWFGTPELKFTKLPSGSSSPSGNQEVLQNNDIELQEVEAIRHQLVMQENDLWTRLFEYGQTEDKSDKIDQTETEEKGESEEEEEVLNNKGFVGSGNFKRKETYVENDLLEMWENRRFQTPYVVYKWMDWWPFFDFLAMYGHIVHNLVIVSLSINSSVSVYMCLNLVGVVCFYTIATFRLQSRATDTLEAFGMQSQTDLQTAKLMTKEYKKISHAEFLGIRAIVWKV
jgi:hypothetical protein